MLNVQNMANCPGTINCEMCPLTFRSRPKHIIHVLKHHKDENRYSVSCSFGGCKYSSRSWPAFRKHCTRVHKVSWSDVFATEGPTVVDGEEVNETIEMSSDEEQSVRLIPQRKPTSSSMVAKFLLKLETKHHLTRKGLDSVTACVDKILNEICSQVVGSLQNSLELSTKDPIIQNAAESCKSDMSNLLSESARHRVYTKSFHFLSPQPILRQGELKEIGYIVPFAQLLNLLMQQDQIWKTLRKKRRNRSIMTDFGDGTYLQNHEMINKDFFLQLGLYYDDLELQNPLRSNKRHKLGMFYVTILNFPVNLRSQLQNIFAVAIARVSSIKRAGFSSILDDFLQTVKTLRTTGLEITRGEEKHRVFGDLVAVMCDTPAAAALGGFKVSSSFSSHFCRTCLATKSSFESVSSCHYFQMREMRTYLDQCATIENKRLQKRRSFWSKLYGINMKSCLCFIPNFPVTKCLLQDPMHILLEGCLPYVLALFLQEKIFSERVFTLDELNEFISTPSTFKQDKKDVAVPIDAKHIRTDKHIKQKASIMLVMAYILPIFLAKYFFADAMYNNLLSIIRVTCFCFRPKCDKTMAGILEQEITEFLESFRCCYPDAKVKPKMHFLLHFPRQLLEFGPLRNHSTMRAEGKHQSFKDHRWRNFINLPNSLLKREQLCLAERLVDDAGNFVSDFLQEPNAAKGRIVPLSQLEGSIVNMISQCCIQEKVQVVDVVKDSNSVMWGGRVYEKGDCLLVSECEVTGPKFVTLDKLYTNFDAISEVFAVARELQTVDFDPGLNAHRVIQKDKKVFVCVSKLAMNWSVPMHNVRDALYIVNRYGIMC